jgi:hypothetical protein
MECDREEQTLEAVMSGRWRTVPEDDGLRVHMDSCPICRDLAIVAAALRNERDEAMREAPVPTSGQVWWRATLRMRAEAAATATRPIAAVQAVAGACAAGLCAGLLTLTWPSIQPPLVWVAEQSLLWALVVLGATVVVTPVVLYLALSDD